MISSIFLNKVYKAGDIAFQLNALYDKKINGHTTCRLIDFGEVPLDRGIQYQEERLKTMIKEIQKGFKTDLGLE